MKTFFSGVLFSIIGAAIVAAFISLLFFLMGGLRPSWRSLTNVSFSSVNTYIQDSDRKDIRGLLMLKGAVYQSKEFDIWADVEKTSIAIVYQSGLEGTVLNVKPTFKEWCFGPSPIFDASQIKIITGYADDLVKWEKLIEDLKEKLNYRRQQKDYPVRVKP